ncbi:unnamed protein product [marine sediment metagenome]|uniref:Uncharacterized protein n=1 Tax=marine sediment metagenome TaxID=412755 RepID=X1T7Z5_9ZZZZ
MTWKPRVIIAGSIILVAMVLNVFGINTFTQYIGLLAAGYLFGTAQNIKPPEGG